MNHQSVNIICFVSCEKALFNHKLQNLYENVRKDERTYPESFLSRMLVKDTQCKAGRKDRDHDGNHLVTGGGFRHTEFFFYNHLKKRVGSLSLKKINKVGVNYKHKMALVELLRPPKSMMLERSEQTINEGYTPGLRYLPAVDESPSVLLNATYNQYNITNHYKSKDQCDKNDKLRRKIKNLEDCHEVLQRKYKAAKTLLNRTMPLLSFIVVDDLDPLIREEILGLKEKWGIVESYKNKRKMEEDVQAHKKRKTTV